MSQAEKIATTAINEMWDYLFGDDEEWDDETLSVIAEMVQQASADIAASR